ncbi:MAG: VWA domain-containing protein [Saprospiraceae bacterium]|nr:VWA domain-containing protein [Saprospiraceae bacterium]
MKRRFPWYGTAMEDGFRTDVPYSVMIAGRRMFVQKTRAKMDAARQRMRIARTIDHMAASNPQTLFFYQQVPPSLTADANIGLSLFLEAKRSWTLSSREICGRMGEGYHYLDPFFKVFDKFLLFHWLTADSSISEELETYRCVSASTLEIEQIVTLDKLWLAALFYSDLKLWKHQADELISIKRNFFEVAEKLKKRYLSAASVFSSLQTYRLAASRFVDACCEELLDRAVMRHEGYFPIEEVIYEDLESTDNDCHKVIMLEQGGLMSSNNQQASSDLPIIGTDMNTAKQTAKDLFDQKAIADLMKAIEESIDHTSEREAPRVDLLEIEPFQATSMTLEMEEVVQLEVSFGDEKVSGAVVERLVPPTGDVFRIEKMKVHTEVVARSLSSVLYEHEVSDLSWKRSESGIRLNAKMLPLFRTESLIFEHRVPFREKRFDGKPVLQILYDGSGSMGGDRFEMAKLLTATFIRFGQMRGLNIEAAVYGSRGVDHLDFLHDRTSKPTLEETFDRIISSQIYGGQRDALAIGSLLKGTLRKYRCRSSHLIFITDEGFCQSFPGSRFCSPLEEVTEMIKKGYNDWFNDHFEVTLVSFRPEGTSTLRGIVDHIIYVEPNELSDLMGLATKIGSYVAKRIF